jgi:hypothetical protein
VSGTRGPGGVAAGLLLAALAAVFAPAAPLAAQEGCRPEPLESPAAWSEGLIGLLREARFDDAAELMHRHSCIPVDRLRPAVDLVQRWKSADEIAHVDLIQDVRLGATLEKLTYAVRDARDNLIFMELKFVRGAAGFRLYNYRVNTELEDMVPF